MAVMAREMWTDQRLDDLNERVASLDRRMEAGFAEMREEFRAVRSEMTAMNRTLVQTMVGGFVATWVGLAGIAAIMLTQG
jgi:predicted esterase YcpF (UPF0227 family)